MRLFPLLLVPAALFAAQPRYARLGDFEGQVEVQLHASDPWIELARLKLGRGDTAGAEEALRNAVNADPGSIEGRFLLARIALRSGRPDDAHQRLREIEAIQKATSPAR